MTLISHKKFMINQDNAYCENQINNLYAQTSLLINRVEFKSSKELSDDSDDDGDIMSIQRLKSKYNVLIPDSKKFSLNGYVSNGKKSNQNVLCSAKEDGNDLGEPKHILYHPDNVILEWKKISKIGCGLSNLGNTCFMNSVLQSLAYCPPFINYLDSVKDDHSSKCRSNFCMICLMLKHIGLIWNQNYNGQQIVKPFYISQRLKSIAKHFTYGRQEDAHEFLRYIIEHMWRSCLSIHEHEFGIAGTSSKFDSLTKTTTAINQIFGGYNRSQVLCMQCKEKSNTYDYSMDFMLDIQNASSLEDALQKFVTPEILRNENAYKCSKCKKLVVAKKQFTVYKAPNVATFQIKRFDGSKMFGKVTKTISYPEKLNLRPYMSEKGPPLNYKLISVLVHFGSSSNSGHYFCYVRNSNNCWYLMDDSRVSQVTLSEVLNQKAYVLFYNRLPNDQPNTQMHVNSNKRFNPNFKFAPSCKSSEKLNSSIFNSNDKIENEANVNLTKKNIPHKLTSNVLVPYDEDSDTEKNDQNCTPDNSLTKSEQELKLNRNNSGDIDNSLTNSSSKEKEYIPILKVKATTNSWQVVESTNINLQSQTNFQNTTSNWKIIKTSILDNFTENNKCREYLEHNCLTNSNITSTIDDKISNSKSKHDRFSLDSKTKKDKKRHKKKMKEKRKKRENNSTEDSIELKWVERTKETLELEKGGNVLIKDVPEKRKFTQDSTDVYNSNKKPKCLSNDNKKPDILDALLKNVSRGYGDNVKSWNGGISNLNKAISEDLNKTNLSNNDAEDYNDEFDMGKVKKLKNKVDMFESIKSESVKNNPFQRFQHSKYARNNHNGFSSGSSLKLMKFNNTNDFKSKKLGRPNYIKEKYFDNKSGKSHYHKPNLEYSPKNNNLKLG